MAAIEVLGSVATGTADEHSDLDLLVVWDAPDLNGVRDPTLPDGLATRIDLAPYLRDGECLERYRSGPVDVDLRHITCAGLRAVLDAVLTRFDLDARRQVLVWLILTGKPLHGRSLIQRLQARAEPYPAGLARVMVAHHLAFYPPDWVDRLLLRRRRPLLARHTIRHMAENLLGILLGLNRLYGSIDVAKLFDRWIERMRHRPPDFRARLDAVLAAPPARGLRLLARLAADVLALVEAHMPEVDVGPARRTLALRAQPWRGLAGGRRPYGRPRAPDAAGGPAAAWPAVRRRAAAAWPARGPPDGRQPVAP